jgi:parallel beta-helix repeat protein
MDGNDWRKEEIAMRRFVFLLFFLLPLQAWGATYYMRADGTAANKGAATGPCGAVGTAMNVTVHNGETFAAGDVINLCDDGGVFRGSLVTPSPGSEGSPITYVAAPGDTPIISYSGQLSGFSDQGGNIWRISDTTDPVQVWFAGTHGVQRDKVATLTQEYDWYWDGGNNYLSVYAASDPDSRYSIVEKSWEGVHSIVNKHSYITFDGIEVRRSGGAAIYAYADTSENLTGVTVRNSNLHDNWGDGVAIHNTNNSSCAYTASSIITDNNTIYNNGYYGVTYINCFTSGTISHNTVYSNGKRDWSGGSSGISVGTNHGTDDPMSNVIIEYNNVYKQEDNSGTGGEGMGIAIDNDSVGVIARYNKIHDNAGSGISVNLSSGSRVYYNLMYGNNTDNDNHAGGIQVLNSDDVDIFNNVFFKNAYSGAYIYDDDSSTNDIVLRNNIFSENGTYEIVVFPNATNKFSSNYNVIYHSSGGNFLRWSGSNYSFENWKSTSKQDSNSLSTDPSMTDPGNDDFTLQSSSHAINAGTEVSLTKDYRGNAVPYGSAPDMGSYEWRPIGKTPSPPLNIIISK